MRIETPPPADLVVTNVVVPNSAQIGDEIEVTFTIQNTSINPAYGRWTDALYLSADNAWDLNDIQIGKVATSATWARTAPTPPRSRPSCPR